MATKSSRRANSGFQAYNVRRALASAGLETEKIDVSAHLDRSLSLRENVANIKRQYGAGPSKARKEASMMKGPRMKKEETQGTFYQVGKSNTNRDKKRTAKPPGERRSRSGRWYTERRKNRSDRPGPHRI